MKTSHIITTIIKKNNIEKTSNFVSEEEGNMLALYDRYDVKFPHIVLIQSQLETGYYKSDICRINKNRHGMKHNHRKISLKKNLGHAYYASVGDGVKDYKLWQKEKMNAHETFFKKKILTDDDYYFFLENIVIGKGVYRYAEDPIYINKLKAIAKNNNNKIATVIKKMGKNGNLISSVNNIHPNPFNAEYK